MQNVEPIRLLLFLIPTFFFLIFVVDTSWLEQPNGDHTLKQHFIILIRHLTKNLRKIFWYTRSRHRFEPILQIWFIFFFLLSVYISLFKYFTFIVSTNILGICQQYYLGWIFFGLFFHWVFIFVNGLDTFIPFLFIRWNNIATKMGSHWPNEE